MMWWLFWLWLGGVIALMLVDTIPGNSDQEAPLWVVALNTGAWPIMLLIGHIAVRRDRR